MGMAQMIQVENQDLSALGNRAALAMCGRDTTYRAFQAACQIIFDGLHADVEQVRLYLLDPAERMLREEAVVDAFGGQPGVDTAFYATRFGYAKGDDNNVTALLEEMQGLTHRRAAMVSTLVAVRSAQDPEPLIAVGRVVVDITSERLGQNGFGFDPVMCLPALGQTFAQLPNDVKNAHSHRGAAAQAMLALIRERWLA